MPQRPVDGMADVERTNVPVAGPAQVGDIDRVRLKDADRIGTDEEAVRVELERRRIVVVMHADLSGVTRPYEVLAIIVRDDDLLMAVTEAVEQAVGVLFL